MSISPFGLILSGRRVITLPTSTISPTSFVYTLPSSPPFNHIVVFLLPEINLPPNTAAAVYISRPNSTIDFKFLGAIGEGKESAIFKINGLGSGIKGETAGGEVDMDAPEEGTSINLGISIESAGSVAAQMAALSNPSWTEPPASSLALVRANRSKPDTLVLAQKIIKNAFNFLASFDNGGTIPLKAFESWWLKFEARAKAEPDFLEKSED